MSEIICKFDSEFSKLEGSQIQKARKLIKDKLIAKAGRYYIISPIPNYNVSTYWVDVIDPYNLTCTCQYYSRFKRKCTHIIAVQFLLKEELNG